MVRHITARPSRRCARPFGKPLIPRTEAQGTSQKGFLDLPFDPVAAAIKPHYEWQHHYTGRTHIGRVTGPLLRHPFNLLLPLTLLTINLRGRADREVTGPARCSLALGGVIGTILKRCQWRVKCLPPNAALKLVAS